MSLARGKVLLLCPAAVVAAAAAAAASAALLPSSPTALHRHYKFRNSESASLLRPSAPFGIFKRNMGVALSKGVQYNEDGSVKNCLFCDIIADIPGKRQTEVAYQDDKVCNR